MPILQAKTGQYIVYIKYGHADIRHAHAGQQKAIWKATRDAATDGGEPGQLPPFPWTQASRNRLEG